MFLLRQLKIFITSQSDQEDLKVLEGLRTMVIIEFHVAISAMFGDIFE